MPGEIVTPVAVNALLSMGEAAQLLGVSIRTVIRQMHAGDLVPVRIGSRTLFASDDLAAFIESRKETSRPASGSPECPRPLRESDGQRER